MKKSLLRRCLNRTLAMAARFSPGSTTLRPLLHRLRGVKIGRSVFIGDDVYLDNEYPESIEIQDGVQISIRAVIVAHTRGPGRVIIEKEAFVGPHAVIACSAGRLVKIGQGAVIGPGCVVTKSVPARLYFAPPAIKPVARVEVPLTTAESIESFQAGLLPLDEGSRASGWTKGRN